ncbi:sulfatase [Bacteroidota bacterium]
MRVTIQDIKREIKLGVCLLAGLIPACKSSNREAEDLNKEKPNFLFILTDDQRWDALGAAGNSIIHTPNMDELASTGIRFNRAFVSTPISAASRASILTGLYERTHGYNFGTVPIQKSDTDASYPVLLRNAGYRTGFIGKFGIKVEKDVREEMFDQIKSGGWAYIQQKNGKTRHLTEIHGDMAVDFLRENDPEKPFCLSISFNAPHADDGAKEQYFWPSSCNNLYKDIKIPTPETADPAFFDALPEYLKTTMNRERWYWRYDTPEKFQKMVKGYYKMISGIDEVLGRLINELKILGYDKNTVIILMGDNGYFLGERGYAGKWLMHDHSIRVPLIIYDPQNPEKYQGSVLDQMVMNIDISPTILDMAGLKLPETIQGKSLKPLLKNHNKKWRDYIFTEHLINNPTIPKTEGYRDDRWKFIRYNDKTDLTELYDLKNDPEEINNLAGESQYSGKIDKFSNICDEMIESLLRK